MTETLRQKQSRFAVMVARLIDKATVMGFEVTLGDAYRDERAFGKMGEKKAYGNPRSCHKLRLAIDLNLFKNGFYLGNTEAHEELGKWWESQGADHRWGGRFKDGNHYSFEHEGNK